MRFPRALLQDACTMSQRTLSAHEARQIAVLAMVDPRTVHQYLQGNAQSTTSARIELALRELGRQDLLTPHQEKADG